MKGTDWFRRPEMVLADIIDKGARDESDRLYYRALVVAVDLEGGKLENPDGSGVVKVTLRDGSQKSYPANVGAKNPRGAVKARILTDGFDRLLDDKSLRVYWPMFPQDLAGTPVTPGEHVYVMFEGEGTGNGVWISRVAGQESANSYAGVDSYDAPSAPESAMDSFEENGPEYPRDETYAGLAPSNGAMAIYEED